MMYQWELVDVYKALFALAAGLILGLERELKDKAAGLKTISVITLGSALFAIISFKIGSPYNEPTRIASYIVSGIGFLGAGVIFKDGVNVSGLTTASVIWLASAVGMAIGFGDIFLAAVFLGISLLIIYGGNFATSFFPGGKLTRVISITLPGNKAELRQPLIKGMQLYTDRMEIKKLIHKAEKITIVIDAIIEKEKMKEMEDYLLRSPEILEFEL